MDGFLSVGDGTAITALVGAIVTLFGLTWRKAHVVGNEVASVAQEARVAVTEARDTAEEARTAATAVQVQMLPNGGSTLRDAVDRLEKGQANIGLLADRMAVTADRIDTRTLLLDQRLTTSDNDTDRRLAALEAAVFTNKQGAHP